MDAKAKTVNEILYASNQYIVPFFQRQYSWTQKHWRRLWEDLGALLEDGGTNQHFLGPMVCTSYRNVPGEVPAHLLIDGQQRMTTLTVLLAALRDASQQRGRRDLAEEITESFLTHKHKNDLQRYKVIPRIVDRDALIAIVEGQSTGSDRQSLVAPAMRFFRKQIERQTADGADQALRAILTAVTDRLSLVVITIDGENPYEIFESLNSTGLPLEESDLIRNFIFMQVPTNQQEEFWTKHWGPLEEQFGKEDERAAALTQFYRSYLMRKGQYSKQRATFVDFKAQRGTPGISPREVAVELRRFAKYELWLRRPETCGQPDLQKRLGRVALLDITTAHPLLMHLLDRHERGQLDEQALLSCIDDLCSFALRRSICGETTRPYARWFPEAVREIKDAPRDDLRRYYLRCGWPDDEAFAPSLIEFPTYRREFKKARLMLEAMEESHGHKEQVDLAKLTIEHVMPQTLSGKAGPEWQRMLGQDWQRAHDRMLHALGNLTLTGYNPDMSNHSYAEKRAAFAESNVQLNKYFAAVETWDEEAIRRRGRTMAGTVAGIWPRPVGPPYIHHGQKKRQRMSADERLEYWQVFLGSPEWDKQWRLPKASRGGNLRFRLGVRGFRLVVYMFRGDRVGVLLSCRGPNAAEHWGKLREQQVALEQETGLPLTWETDNRGARFIASGRSVDLSNRDDWTKQHAWLRRTMDAMRTALLPRLRELAGTDALEDTRQLKLDYWTRLREMLLERNGPIRPRKPYAQHWMDFRVGRSSFSIFASMHTREEWIRVGLGCYGTNAGKHYRLLQEDKEAIERELGVPLQWEELPDRKESRLTLYLDDAAPANRADWPRQHSWLIEKLEAFYAALAQRVRDLPRSGL